MSEDWFPFAGRTVQPIPTGLDSATLKAAAADYLDGFVDGEAAAFIGNGLARDIALGLMVGFACRVLIEQLTDLVVPQEER